MAKTNKLVAGAAILAAALLAVACGGQPTQNATTPEQTSQAPAETTTAAAPADQAAAPAAAAPAENVAAPAADKDQAPAEQPHN